MCPTIGQAALLKNPSRYLPSYAESAFRHLHLSHPFTSSRSPELEAHRIKVQKSSFLDALCTPLARLTLCYLLDLLSSGVRRSFPFFFSLSLANRSVQNQHV